MGMVGRKSQLKMAINRNEDYCNGQLMLIVQSPVSTEEHILASTEGM